MYLYCCAVDAWTWEMGGSSLFRNERGKHHQSVGKWVLEALSAAQERKLFSSSSETIIALYTFFPVSHGKYETEYFRFFYGKRKHDAFFPGFR